VPPGLRRDIGQLLIGSLPGTTITPELRSLAREFSLGGVTIFARNIEVPEQVAELSRDLQELATELPLWVCVDQEGGRVARLKAPFTEWPPMAVLGRSGDPALAERFAGALAAELRAVGITLDYAPVLDIHTNPDNLVIGDRALGDSAELVARLGAAVIRGLQAGGVAACGKHFPGHGDTSTDSHVELPLVEHEVARLRAIEFEPFRAAVEEQVAFIMTAHVLVPALDENRPATLSPHVVQKLLREELKYEGVILSDDLEMKAVSAQYAVPDAAVDAIRAGCDAVLVCQGDVDLQARTLEALVKAIESGKIPAKRCDDAFLRLKRVKQRFLTGERLGPTARIRALRGVLGREEHQVVAAQMAAYL
jgi:beta-N-acetylhexosaminidase